MHKKSNQFLLVAYRTPPKNFIKISQQLFLSYPVNSDRQTDKRWLKHILLGGGNNVVGLAWASLDGHPADCIRFLLKRRIHLTSPVRLYARAQLWLRSSSSACPLSSVCASSSLDSSSFDGIHNIPFRRLHVVVTLCCYWAIYSRLVVAASVQRQN